MILNPHNNVEAYQWSAESWVKIGEVVGTSGSSSKRTIMVLIMTMFLLLKFKKGATTQTSLQCH